MNVCALDESGKAADWWFAYKVPKLAPNTATGYEYVFYDPQTGTLAASPYQLTDGKDALDLTVMSRPVHPG